MLLKIARRNLLRHKGKSLVVGIILFIGSLVMTIGSATVTAMEKNVTRTFIDSFMGDITIMSKKQKNEGVFMQMMGETTEVMADYAKTADILSGHQDVDSFIPYCYSIPMMLAGNDNPTGYPAICAIYAAELDQYQKMFSNISPVEGKLPLRGERGILLSKYMRDMYYLVNQDLYYPANTPFSAQYFPEGITNARHEDVSLKHNIVLMGYSARNSSGDVSVPVRAVFRWTRLDNFWREVSVMDIASYREMMNYRIGGDIVISRQESRLLEINTDNPEAMFAEKIETAGITAQKVSKPEFSRAAGKDDFDNNAWELIAVKLKDHNQKKRAVTIRELNNIFTEKNIDAKAVTWETFAGAMAGFIKGIRTGLFVFVSLIFIVAIIIIMNTLAMSTLERSAELGMMRAVGARRKFIGFMLLGETFTLSAIFGGLGIICGGLMSAIFSYLKLPVKNEMMQIITGNAWYAPEFTAADALTGIILLILVTVLSVIYPLRISFRISPLDAVERN